MYDFGPLVHGFLNQPYDQSSATYGAIVINYSWRYADQNDVKAATQLVQQWTDILGFNGVFYDDVHNWKFWPDPNGYTATVEFLSFYAYQDYLELERLYDFDFFGTMQKYSQHHRVTVVGNVEPTSL